MRVRERLWMSLLSGGQRAHWPLMATCSPAIKMTTNDYEWFRTNPTQTEENATQKKSLKSELELKENFWGPFGHISVCSSILLLQFTAIRFTRLFVARRRVGVSSVSCNWTWSFSRIRSTTDRVNLHLRYLKYHFCLVVTSLTADVFVDYCNCSGTKCSLLGSLTGSLVTIHW